MLDGDGYLTLDSKSFSDVYKMNRVYRFTNELHPKLDNFKYDYEIALLSINVLGKESFKKTTHNITCSIIEKYQCGESLCQNIRTILMWIRDYDAVDVHNVVPENIYVVATPQYYRIQRGIFDEITMGIEPLHLTNISIDEPYHMEHVILRLHLRKIENEEVRNLYMK